MGTIVQGDDELISVVIPFYNSSTTIQQSIESVLMQNIADLEIILIDDGSTDDSGIIAKKTLYSSHFTNYKLFRQRNAGVATARNAGIHYASGEWIAFLDADDHWLPGKLALQLAYIEENPQIRFIGCNRNGENPFKNLKRSNPIKIDLGWLLLKIHPQTSTVLVKKSLLLRVGMYDVTMTHSEDADLWMRIATIESLYSLHETLVVTGSGKANFGCSGLSANVAEMHRGLLYALKKLRSHKHLKLPHYLFYVSYEKCKYLRRLLIVFFRRRRKLGPLTSGGQK